MGSVREIERDGEWVKEVDRKKERERERKGDSICTSVNCICLP